MKKKKVIETKEEREFKEQLRDAVKLVAENITTIKEIDKYFLFDFQIIFNQSGYSLVETKNLNDFYNLESFCNNNQVEIINHSF